MCLGVPPSCGVHSLLGNRHVRASGAVHGQDWYAKGCHACDVLAAEHGVPTIARPPDG